MTESDATHVKVVFQLEPDADGYPPVRLEGLWATRVPGTVDVYALDNIPFYACVALGDHVRARPEEGDLRAVELVRASGHGTVRVVAAPDRLREIRKLAGDCGCASELSDEMVAIDVPPGADWSRLRAELARQHELEVLDYQEAVLPVANADSD